MWGDEAGNESESEAISREWMKKLVVCSSNQTCITGSLAAAALTDAVLHSRTYRLSRSAYQPSNRSAEPSYLRSAHSSA